jgi:hypothetical protein
MRNFLSAVAAAVLSTSICAAQCNPHPFRPSLRPPCYESADLLGAKIPPAPDDARIKSARDRFWKAFPEGSDYDAAEKEYLMDLAQQDMLILMNLLNPGAPETVGNAIRDAAIRPFAKNAFRVWTMGLRRANGRDRAGTITTPTIMFDAIRDQSMWRRSYEYARNWAEFITTRGVHVPDDLDRFAAKEKITGAELYIVRQIEGELCVLYAQQKVNGQKVDDMPVEPLEASRGMYDSFVEMFGEKPVEEAARKAMLAPKNSVGGLASKAKIEIGAMIGESPDPYMHFLNGVTHSSARAYAISMALDAEALLGGQAETTLYTQQRWEEAFKQYNAAVQAYTEQNVLNAARKLMYLTKDPDGGILGDQQRKSVMYWFTSLIKDPNTPIPDGQVAHFKAGSYDDRWLGKFVVVRGTISRVDVDRTGWPRYSVIHFKESKDDGFFVYSPNSDELQGAFGNDFSRLIGRQVDVSGQVQSFRGGAGVHVEAQREIQVLEFANDFRESRPDWLKEARPVMVESPKYLAWKKFPLGSSATYETRNLFENAPATDQYQRTKIARFTMMLQSIDEKKAVVTASTTTWGRNGEPRQSTDTRVYPAKESPPVAPPRVTRGTETLFINGRKFDTTWELQPFPTDPQTFTKTWRSDDVPGGVVLETRQGHTEVLGGTRRTISQTIFVAVDGVEPELSRETPAGSPVPATAPAPNRSLGGGRGAVAGGRGQTPPIPPGSVSASLSRRYQDLAVRYIIAKNRLGLIARRGQVPAEVQAATDRLDVQINAAQATLRAGDYASAEQHLRASEESLTVIENFVQR